MIYVCNVSYEHERVRLTQKVRISEKSRDADRDFLLNFVTPIVIFLLNFVPLKVQLIVPVGISNPLRVISHHVGSLKNNRVK